MMPIAMAHKRRSFDEALAIAGPLFAKQLPDRLAAEEVEDLKRNGSFGGGPARQQDLEAFGVQSDPKMYYFFEWALPGSTCGAPPTKIFAVALVSRDRASDFCKLIWRPAKGYESEASR